MKSLTLSNFKHDILPETKQIDDNKIFEQFNNLLNSFESFSNNFNELINIKNIIDKYGLHKSLIVYLNQDNQLNKLFKENNINYIIISNESLDSWLSDESLKICYEAINETIKKYYEKIKEFIKKIINYIKSVFSIQRYNNCIKQINDIKKLIKNKLFNNKEIEAVPYKDLKNYLDYVYNLLTHIEPKAKDIIKYLDSNLNIPISSAHIAEIQALSDKYPNKKIINIKNEYNSNNLLELSLIMEKIINISKQIIDDINKQSIDFHAEIASFESNTRIDNEVRQKNINKFKLYSNISSIMLKSMAFIQNNVFKFYIHQINNIML